VAVEDNEGKGAKPDYVTVVTVRLPVSLLEKVDAVCLQRGENRSDYIRGLLERSTARALPTAAAAGQ
jgi:hypothetical protein